MMRSKVFSLVIVIVFSLFFAVTEAFQLYNIYGTNAIHNSIADSWRRHVHGGDRLHSHYYSQQSIHPLTAPRTTTTVTTNTRKITSTTRQYMMGSKSWFEDDLPNILGINPIEAALVVGILYYFYGSETLYEYAREAGRLFAIYTPIVKDVTVNIFTEFRDYFEENRERDLMKKAGVNVDKMNRRTSNVFERFQQGLKVSSV